MPVVDAGAGASAPILGDVADVDGGARDRLDGHRRAGDRQVGSDLERRRDDDVVALVELGARCGPASTTAMMR